MTMLPDRAPPSTRPPQSRSERLSSCWQERGIEPDALQLRDGTLISPRGDSALTATLGSLPALLEPADSGAAPFQLGATLGKGGMGIVRSATQTALDREVAIKSLHASGQREHSAESAVDTPLELDWRHERAAARLVLEARVAGTLEHPNILPIHALGHDARGMPLIVMKHIDGQSWGARLQQCNEAQRRSETYLREQLAILAKVIDAVRFAHSRGILHRDIKPDNVMLGDYGEVYLADWGLAAALREEVVRGLKQVRDINSIEGTPGYLAPEMVIGEGDMIDERSDIYLLGATLYHIVSGEPPHQGESLKEILRNAFMVEPLWPAWMPDELRLIGQCAMRFDAHERFANAAELSQAIDDFLVHRSSHLLSHAAHQRLKQLEQLIDEAQHTQPQTEQNAPTDRELQGCFRECRFAFDQALTQWPSNQAAQRGLEQALTQMIEFELSRGGVVAAEHLFADLTQPDDALRHRLDQAKEQQQAEHERLAQLKRDADVRLGAHQRKLTAYVTAPLWALCFISFGVLTRSGVHAVRHWEVALVDAVFLIALLLHNPARAASAQFNDVNRRALQTTRLAFAIITCIWAGAPLLDLSLPATSALHLIVSGTIWAVMAINIDRAIIPMPLLMAMGLLGVLLWPGYHFEWLGVAGGLGSLLAARGYGRS